MALRMQVYIGLLYQDLVKRKELSPDALLPPVLPLVFLQRRSCLDRGDRPGRGYHGWARQFEAVPGRPTLCADRSAAPQLQAFGGTRVRTRNALSAGTFGSAGRLTGGIATARSVAKAGCSGTPAAVCGGVGGAVAGPTVQGSTLAAVLELDRGIDMGARKFETWADYLEDKGRQQGIQLSMQQGMQQGMKQAGDLAAGPVRAALQGVLVKRFGAIPPPVQARLDQASIDELSAWLVPALETPNIEALLGLPAAS